MSLTREQAAALGVPAHILAQAYPDQRAQVATPRVATATPRVATAARRSWTFVVEGAPVPKGRPRVGKHGTITPQRTRTYEAAVADAARGLCALGDGPATVRVLVWLPNWRRLDLDNVLKSVCDALVLAGAISDDSARVVRSCGIECVGVDKARPRIEVELTTMEA